MAKNGRFEKGHKGGPGRPKGSAAMGWCREFAEAEGKVKLMAWARSKNPKASIEALKLIFAYGYGKPTEHHEHGIDDSLAEILDRIKRGDARAGDVAL